MDERQRKRLIDLHRQSYARHGHSPHALFWGSRGIQKLRFRVLAGIGIASGDSVLDVGCGFAELYSWLESQNLAVVYTGIDLSPDILARGRSMHRDAELLCGELFDFDFPVDSQAGAFDWVVLSGTLNWQLNDHGDYARRLIRRMFELCRKGLAFNMLNAREQDMRALPDLVGYDPDEMQKFCRKMSSDVQCRTDYLANDFTIYMRRPEI